MEIGVTGHVPVRGDCGHEFEVAIAGIENDFECPVCGAKDRFSEEQLRSIKDQIGKAAAKFGAEQYAEALRKSLARGARGGKGVQYRPKR